MNTVTEYISRVKDLCDFDPGREVPVFFIAGPVNSGKSTLVNGLLEQRVCPDDPAPSTLFPVYFRHGESPSAFKTVRGKAVKLPDRELRDLLKSRRRSTAPDRADVFLPPDILRWFSLVDTPGAGLGGDADARLLDCLSGADGIVFLFHQRGIDAATHRFLASLAAAGLKGWISFWINANLGTIDGTSLSDTVQALKALFPGRAEVHAINTRDRKSTGLISQFLQVKALESAVRDIESGLSRRDRVIPGLLERASLLEDDERFLIKFWDIVKDAEAINHTRQAVRDLPLIYGSTINMLQANNCRLITESTAVRAGEGGGPAPPGAWDRISSLISEIESDRDLARCAGGDVLKRAADVLEEKCRVLVAGSFSTGKTTFLNALLGETLLPAEDRATTSCTIGVGYGSLKEARVQYLYRAEFSPVACRDGKYTLDREEMTAVTRILDTPQLRALVSGCHILRDGRHTEVPLSRLPDILEEIARTCGKEAVGWTNPDGLPRVPIFTRRVAGPSLPSPPVTAIRFTLGGRDHRLFRLDDDRQRLEFYRAISPPGSFLTESVSITYPSPILALADFIDTPGMGSLHRRHQDRASGTVLPGDMALVFLHAKHVLSGEAPGDLIALKKSDPDLPVIYVINFADTVTAPEREKVSLYIRQAVGSQAGPGEIIPYPQVYTISALNALRGSDEGFDRLLRRVRKKMEEIRARKITRATGGIKEWLEKAASPEGPGRAPGRARQAALYYLEELQRLLRSYL